MNSKACIAGLLAALGTACAQFPAQDMGRTSLGLGYTLAFRGEDITKAAVPSHEILHLISLAYAPAPYVALQAGLGIDRFSVDPYNQVSFHGGYGFSPAFGVSLYSPFFAADMLRVTGGGQMLYLDSDDDFGYRYSGLIANPFLGLILSPSVFVDIAAGGRMHLINGSIQSPGVAADQNFSDQNTARGYLAVTLKTPYEKAFMTLDADFSPGFNSDWSRGPREASVGVSVGAVLGWQGKSQPSSDKPTYFPAYSEMKEKQKKMAEEIQ